MKQFYIFIFVFTSIFTSAQIKGKVVNTKNEPLPYVSIYLENSLTGTTTNDDGLYKLNLNKTGNYTIIFQFLGYKTLKKKVRINTFPFELNVKLVIEEVALDEVLVSSEENPADKIIRSVIKNKDKNTEKWKNYTADFYSRGLFKIKNAPKKILGQKVGDFGGGLDSTRSGIIYLSETISKIKFQKKPKEFKEHIVATKVSGQDNGISFNQAKDVNFNLYQNQVAIDNTELFSPISDYAFTYYKFKLEGVFYDKNGKLINKIKLLPKRKNDRVFGGVIYIVEDDWQVYGSDLTASGEQIGNPAIDLLHIKQNYNYDKSSNSWVLILQTIDFKLGMFGFNINGRFSASYKNYNFNPKFTKESFDDTILSFEKDADKKDSLYWSKLRTVPLTLEEKRDYTRKDSIRMIKKSKKYIDSVDTKRNRFRLLSPIMGYTYQNTPKKYTFSYSGLLGGLDYNTVQGVAPTFNFSYFKRNNDYGDNWSLGAKLNYGFSDKRLRPVFYFSKRWNNYEKPIFYIETGNKIAQFDDRNPIERIENAVYTLFLKRNYAKYYEKTFIKVLFSREVVRGVRLKSSLTYANRKSLFNTTNFSFFEKDRTFRTNNPINITSKNPVFNSHKIFTANVATIINFGSKYIEYPNSRSSVSNRKYPTLSLGYRKTFGSSDSNLHSNFIWARLQQKIYLGNFGKFEYNARSGIFFKSKNIAFVDYYHPLGNETDFATKSRLNSFYQLPYYQLSTNDKYAELHAEHNFEGFILGKIPLLNRLNFHTVLSAKSYFSANTKAYTEYAIGLDNIGWGKWRLLRVDYVRSSYNGVSKGSFMFGLSF